MEEVLRSDGVSTCVVRVEGSTLLECFHRWAEGVSARGAASASHDGVSQVKQRPVPGPVSNSDETIALRACLSRGRSTNRRASSTFSSPTRQGNTFTRNEH